MSSKKELKKNIKKLLIIQAAEEISQDKLYYEITMDEIARKAGVTKKTVYSYFPSKLSLFLNIFENYQQKLYERMVHSLNNDLPIEKALKQLFISLFEFTSENEKLMRLFWALESEETIGSMPREQLDRIHFWDKAILNEMADLMDQGIAKNIIKDYDPKTVFHLFSAVNKGIFVHTSKENKINANDVSARHLFDFYCKLVFDEII